jgi:hypothetical protein
MSPNLDIAVVRSVPLIERFENVNLMPAEMKSPGQGHSAIVSMARREYAFLAPSECFVSSVVKCCRAVGKDFAPFAGAEPTIPPDGASPIRYPAILAGGHRCNSIKNGASSSR